MTTIAVIGLGRMGRPIAARLTAAGFTVRGWNRTPRDLPEGVTTADTPAQTMADADIVLTMLADDMAYSWLSGEEDLLGTIPPGALHVAMSTISLQMITVLEGFADAFGHRFVAAPVFGRPDAAAAGQLWIVPGGAAADLEVLAPVFAAIGRGTWPMAGPREAMLAKLLGNFLLAGTAELFAEALVAGEKGGIAPEQLFAMLSGTLFGSPAVQRYGTSVVTTQFEPAGFPLRLGLKDVELALAAAREVEAPLPVGGIIRDHMLTAMARGRAEIDWAGLATVVRENAGLPPTRS